jgi:hypothetical protein
MMVKAGVLEAIPIIELMSMIKFTEQIITS